MPTSPSDDLKPGEMRIDKVTQAPSNPGTMITHIRFKPLQPLEYVQCTITLDQLKTLFPHHPEEWYENVIGNIRSIIPPGEENDNCL
jgi:hypothetical protein